MFCPLFISVQVGFPDQDQERPYWYDVASHSSRSCSDTSFDTNRNICIYTHAVRTSDELQVGGQSNWTAAAEHGPTWVLQRQTCVGLRPEVHKRDRRQRCTPSTRHASCDCVPSCSLLHRLAQGAAIVRLLGFAHRCLPYGCLQQASRGSQAHLSSHRQSAPKG